RAGLVGADGPTHHGLFDIAYLRHLPNMVVTAPKDAAELRQLLYSATKYARPTSVRYPRGTCEGVDSATPFTEIPIGTGELLISGDDLTIVALGTMVAPAICAAERLAKIGVKAGVINARFVKPIDSALILAEARRTGKVLTVEEGALQGGFGSAVSELLVDNELSCTVKRLGVPDRFIEHGTQAELLSELGLDSDGIYKAALVCAGVDEADQKIAN
ncbi:MAG: transketolase C-terminal domain-containing protein, partial [Thermodesulfobacteriota bacterium]